MNVKVMSTLEGPDHMIELSDSSSISVALHIFFSAHVFDWSFLISTISCSTEYLRRGKNIVFLPFYPHSLKTKKTLLRYFLIRVLHCQMHNLQASFHFMN